MIAYQHHLLLGLLSCSYFALTSCLISKISLARAKSKSIWNWKYTCDFALLSTNHALDGDASTSHALDVLEEYNGNYLSRIKAGRLAGLSPTAVTLQRAQELKASGIKRERAELKIAMTRVAKVADEITLGIMAESGSKGIQYLRKWVYGLSLPNGILTTVDANNKEIQTETAFENDPVYIKYNSTENGNAYMKKYDGPFVGVIFQPKLKDEEESSKQFRQYGDLPPAVF